MDCTTSQDPELNCKTVKALDVPGMVSIKSNAFVRISKRYQPAQATAATPSVIMFRRPYRYRIESSIQRLSVQSIGEIDSELLLERHLSFLP